MRRRNRGPATNVGSGYQFPTAETGGGECQQILRRWFGSLRKRVDPEKAQYGQLVSDAVDVLTKLRDAFSSGEKPPDSDRKRAGRFGLWAWPSEGTLIERPSNWYEESLVTTTELEGALAAYLKRPWLQDDAIDASAINALLFIELAAFSEQVNSGAAFGIPNWSYILSGRNPLMQLGYSFAFRAIGFFARWVMLPAIAVALLVNNHEAGAELALIVWGIYLVYRLATLPAAFRVRGARRKATEIVQALLKAWSAARGNVVNPSRLKELVLAAEDRGAVLPPALHTLIDRAIARDPTALLRTYDW